MTDVLLGDEKDFVTNYFFRNNFGFSSFEAAVYNLTALPDVCGVMRSGATSKNETLTLPLNSVVYFKLANYEQVSKRFTQR